MWAGKEMEQKQLKAKNNVSHKSVKIEEQKNFGELAHENVSSNNKITIR